ncbi:MAG: lipopolysaccharide biosynthesis protein [Lachnospiraceae bacterium]
MKKKYSSLIRNIGLFTIGSFGSKIVSFLLVPIYTAVLSTSDYGTVDLVFSTVSLLTPVFLLSIQDATLRFSMDSDFKKEDVLSTTFNVIWKGSLILLICVVIVERLGIFNLSLTYYAFFYFLFVVGAINNCLTLYLKAKNKASIIAVSGIICTLVTCVSNILLLVVFKLGIDGYMISNSIGIGVQCLFQLFVGRTYKEVHIKKFNNLSKPMIKYSTPLIANSEAWWVNNASDRFILTWLSGVAENGIYSVAYKIPTILTTFQSIFYNAWSISAISEFDKDDNDGFIGNNYTIYGFLSIIVCSAILIINIPLAKILYSGDFFTAWKSVPFLLVGTAFNGIAQFEGSLFAAVKKTKEVLTTTLAGAIVNTILNLILINFWGAPGAALATMTGYGIMWVLRTYYLNSFIHMKVEWKRHIIAIILLISQAILATVNAGFVLQIIFFVLIIFIHRKYIQTMIRKFRRMSHLTGREK